MAEMIDLEGTIGTATSTAIGEETETVAKSATVITADTARDPETGEAADDRSHPELMTVVRSAQETVLS